MSQTRSRMIGIDGGDSTRVFPSLRELGELALAREIARAR